LSQAFVDIAARLRYPMFIVTVANEDTRAGCLVGFTSQCSIDPPRFMVFISKKNRTHEVAMAAECVAVHLVPEDRMDLAELFGGETGDDIDKFSRCDWELGPAGVPILAGCPSWFAGPVLGRFDAGDHTALLVEPSDGKDGAVSPLGVQEAMEKIEPGHDA
jgi:flavin reductase (DIM6/NTAB) family NADH-FMN oxidoreductase RutF